MNSISFTPNVSAYAACSNNIKSRPVFTGLTKAPKQAQAKEAVGLAKKLYSILFVPRNESVAKMDSGSVYTVSKTSGSVRTYKKYNKWSRQPSETVKSNLSTKINERYIVNKNGGYDVEFQDVHTPGYRISAAYKGIRGKEFTFAPYDGPVTLRYGEKFVEVSKTQRDSLIEKFDKSVDKRYSDVFDKVLKDRTSVDFQELSNRYYQDPEVIGSAILKSPKFIQEQLQTVNSSMPYGIERIFEELGK